MEKKLSDAQVALVAAWRKHPDLRESLEEAASILSLIVFQAETLSDQANELANYIRRQGLEEAEGACRNIDIMRAKWVEVCGEVNQHGIRVYGDAIDRDVD